MVNEAIAELNGEPVVEPFEVTIEVPQPAYLPLEYVAREDLRLDAYRRLAAVTTAAEVDDIEAEWVDRFGPVPEPAAALIGVARLRAECVRAGVRELVVTKGAALSGPPMVARVAPVRLPASRQTRLQRLYKGAHFKEATGELLLPAVRGDGMVPALVDALRELLPDAVVPDGAAVPGSDPGA
jgi:transcription-repair coupling factor (superfamily II helicase)